MASFYTEIAAVELDLLSECQILPKCTEDSSHTKIRPFHV